MKKEQNNLKNTISFYGYSQLLQNYNGFIKNLIIEGNWAKLINILKDSPFIFSNFSDLIINTLRNKKYEPIEDNKIFHITYVFLLHLLKSKAISIKENDENLFFEFLKECLAEINFNDQHLDLFIQVFGNFIIQKDFKSVLKNQNALNKLVIIWSNHLINHFPKLVEIKQFSLAYSLIKSNPVIVKTYPSLSLEVIKQSAYQFSETKKIRMTLEQHNPDLVDQFEKIRDTKKQEFCKNLSKCEKFNSHFEWFKIHNNSNYFSANTDLFSDSEIIKIIKKLVSLNIPLNYQDSVNCGWINWILLEIVWKDKGYNLKNYIEELINLQYYQVVTSYFNKYPQEINNHSMDILSKIRSNDLLELIENYFQFFNIENPEKLFEIIIQNEDIGNAFSKLVRKFQDKKDKFIELIKSHIDKFDLTKSYEENFDIYRIVDVLVSDAWRPLPKPEFPPTYIEEKLTQYLSNVKNADFFNTSSSLSLTRNFHLFTPEFQKRIVELSSKMHRFSFFIALAKNNLRSFMKLFDDIINLEPKDEVDLRMYIYILKLYITNAKKQDIINKIVDRLQKLENNYEKAQLLSYLGNKTQSLQILGELLEKEEYFLQLLFIYADYILEYIRVNIEGLNRIDIEEHIENIMSLKNEYHKHNLRRDRSIKFNFKIEFQIGYLKFLLGQSFFSESDFNEAYKQFKESEEIFYELKNVKPLPEEEKEELEMYFQVVRNFKLLTKQIPSDRAVDIEAINLNLKKKISMIEKKFKVENLKITRFLKNLKHFQIDSENNMKLVIFERPATFCPLPKRIKISKLCLIQNELEGVPDIVYQWDSHNNSIFPYSEIFIDNIWKTYQLTIEYQEKIDPLDFNIEFKKSKIIKDEKEPIKGSKDKLIINFDIIAKEEFEAIKKIEIKIQESHLCEVQSILILPVIYKSKEYHEDKKIEHQILKEVSERIKIYRQKNYEISDYMLYLEQFKNESLRKCMVKHILKRVKDNFYTMKEVGELLNEEINRILPSKEIETYFGVFNDSWNKSQEFWSYYIKKNNLTREGIEIKYMKTILKNLKNGKLKRNSVIFLIDDVIGTGTQFLKLYSKLFNKEIEKKIHENNIKIYLVSVFGSYESRKKISNSTIIGIDQIRYSRVIRDQDKAFSLDEWHNRVELRNFQNYLKKLDPEDWSGWKPEDGENGPEFLLVFDWNTPNSTISCIWKNSENWNALFPRSH